LMPDANGNPTIGDLITADSTAITDQTSAVAAANAATAALTQATAAVTSANSAVTSADAALAAGLVKTGSTYTIDTNGVVTVFEPDSSPRGFHSFLPVPATTPLPTP